MGRPVSTFPDASLSVTEACAVWPTLIDEATLRLPDATGALVPVPAVTPSGALPDLPSAVAVLVTVPACTAVTNPEPFTFATCASELVQTIERPVSAVPPASLSVALAWVDWPATRLGEFRETVTDATAAPDGFEDRAVTVTGTAVLRPDALAVISASPTATAVRRPLLSIEATFAFELLHETLRPSMGLPLTS